MKGASALLRLKLFSSVLFLSLKKRHLILAGIQFQ